jgi:hypothetical protein
MEIPPTLKIGAHTYKVIYVDRVDDDDSDGELNDETGTIKLNKNLMPSALECTLVHEAMHGMNCTLDHVALDSLAEQIYAFFKENNLLR